MEEGVALQYPFYSLSYILFNLSFHFYFIVRDFRHQKTFFETSWLLNNLAGPSAVEESDTWHQVHVARLIIYALC